MPAQKIHSETLYKEEDLVLKKIEGVKAIEDVRHPEKRRERTKKKSLILKTISKFCSVSVILPFVLIMLVVITTFIVWGLMFSNSQSSVDELVSQLQRELSSRIRDSTTELMLVPETVDKVIITEWEQGFLDLLNTTSAFSHIRKLLWRHINTFPKAALITIATRDNIMVIMERTTENTFMSWELYYGDTTRRIYLLNSTTGEHLEGIGPVRNTYNYVATTRGWYRAGRNALYHQPIVFTPVYQYSTGQLGMSISAPLWDANKNVIGVVCTDLTLESISQFMKELQIAQTGKAYIVERLSGLLVASSEGSLSNELGERILSVNSSSLIEKTTSSFLISAYGNYSNIISKGISRTRFTSDYGDMYILQIEPIYINEIVDWVLVIIVPQEDVMSKIWSGNTVTFSTIAAVLVVSIVLSVFLSLFIAMPLYNLSKDMVNVSNLRLNNLKERSSVLWEVRSIQISFVKMTTALKSFAKFVPEAVIRKSMIHNITAEIYLEYANVAVFFLDIADFTSHAEKLSLQELMTVLGEAMEELSTIVDTNGGVVDKYIGDCIMALFINDKSNSLSSLTPSSSSEENIKIARNVELDACVSAVLCLKKILSMHESWKRRGLPQITCRIGIHTGTAMLGNFGSTKRLNYTAIGDTVNLAARLEPLGKTFGVGACISEEVYEKVKDTIVSRALGLIAVKGKSKTTATFTLMKFRSHASKNDLAIEKLSLSMLDSMRRQDLDGTLRFIEESLKVDGFQNDESLLTIQSMAREYVDQPKSYTGVMNMLSK